MACAFPFWSLGLKYSSFKVTTVDKSKTKSNLIKDKIPVLGLDIVESKSNFDNLIIFQKTAEKWMGILWTCCN